MIERPCIRCQSPLTLDEGQLCYCGVCGAAQIFLSEELQQQAADEARRFGERSAAPGFEGGEESAGATAGRVGFGPLRQARGTAAERWPVAVEYALLTSGIAVLFGVGATVFAPLLALDWLWVVSAPILTVGFYHNRARVKGLNAAFAARLGLLTGVLVLAGTAAAFTAGMVVTRFALHSHEIDREVATAFAQVRSTTIAQYGDTAAPVLRLLAVPEFRVGFLLWMLAVTAGLYLVFCVVTAALAGVLLGRRRMA